LSLNPNDPFSSEAHRAFDNRIGPWLNICERCGMGKVIVKIKLTNLSDLLVERRKLSTAKPREVEVEALVDTGATRLYLKPTVIKKLGLERTDTVRSRTTNGDVIRYKYEPVRLELMGRHENFDVVEMPEETPNLLGKAPL
jgi:predicted aspartyl protease